MDTLATLVENLRDSPDELYGTSFLYFQSLFRDLKGSTASKIQLPSYLPGNIYNDRRALGLVIEGAIMAMFDHRVKVDPAKNRSAVKRARRFAENGVLVYTHEMPSEHREQLDEIILDQAAAIGASIFASDLATSRFLDWQHHDCPKFRRGLRALDKAARVDQQLMPAPLTDPFRHKNRKAVIAELRPVLKRIQDEFRARHAINAEAEVLKAFEREASNPDLPFLSNPHNLNLCLRYLRNNPLHLLSISAADLYNELAAAATSHSIDYTRRKLSSEV